jgi:hypothetical protein
MEDLTRPSGIRTAMGLCVMPLFLEIHAGTWRRQVESSAIWACAYVPLLIIIMAVAMSIRFRREYDIHWFSPDAKWKAFGCDLLASAVLGVVAAGCAFLVHIMTMAVLITQPRLEITLVGDASGTQACLQMLFFFISGPIVSTIGACIGRVLRLRLKAFAAATLLRAAGLLAFIPGTARDVLAFTPLPAFESFISASTSWTTSMCVLGGWAAVGCIAAALVVRHMKTTRI